MLSAIGGVQRTLEAFQEILVAEYLAGLEKIRLLSRERREPLEVRWGSLLVANFNDFMLVEKVLQILLGIAQLTSVISIPGLMIT